MKHLHKYKHGFLDKWLLIQLESYKAPEICF